ncbi:MAG: hypothetical protein IT355_10150 [Gemmatimonadaceae bacterium]|nr:hypothetical protein [Gemmatimonadaceae bacterium]
MKLLGRLVLVIVVLLVSWQLARGVHSARYEYNNFHAPRSRPQRPRDGSLPGVQDVQFAGASGTTLRGWYVPSRTGAAVILAGGSGTDRTGMLNEARALVAGGLGVLVFDWPGCGESDGTIGVGDAERAAVRGAVDFVASRPDVRPGRIGILGFSLGSWASLLEGASDMRVAGFVVEGAFDEPRSQTLAEYQRSGLAAQWGAVLGARLAGLARRPDRVVDIVAGIAPRPIVFITGLRDVTVPPPLTRAVHAAAGEPKQLWVVPAASHGGYIAADTSVASRLRAFFLETLAPPVP